MDIKSIRKNTYLTQKDFAAKYHIPLQTLKQWESDPHSKSFRKPPDYVVYLLNEVVTAEYPPNAESPDSTQYSALIRAAADSRGSAAHWMRYLRKLFDDDGFRLTTDQMKGLRDSNSLTMYKIIRETGDEFRINTEDETWLNNSVQNMNSRPPETICDKLYEFSNLTILMPPLEYIAGMNRVE